MLDKDARRENITAARAVADLVKSTLGPKGMDKMIVDTEKNVVLTNKSATILSGISTNHPAVKIIIEAVKTQEKELGDGTTALAFLIGELLWNAEKLFDQGVNAPPILKGYDIAGKMALEYLDGLSSSKSRGDLEKIAFSVLRGKLPEEDARYLAGIAVKAVETGKEEENILVTYRSGGRVRDTRLVDGVVIDLGKRVHPSMPKVVKNARIVLTDREFEVKKIENAKVELSSASKMKAFLRYKEAVLKKAVEIIKASGANVLLCNKNIDDL
ncbi:MAG: TCP-1/cpn60 chaperonin family protein, partial [Candidatus Hydrothermarchaeaceae archaeon]